MSRSGVLMAMMYAMGIKYPATCNGPKINNNVISPPQSEESKQFCLKKAEERRQAKKMKRLRLSKGY